MAKTTTDTLTIDTGDKVILSYSTAQSGEDLSVTVDKSKIRFLPTEQLRKKCGGDLSRLKLIVFDRVGGYEVVSFTGEQPKAFGMHADVVHPRSHDGYYILGESSPIQFTLKNGEHGSFDIKPFIALYEKKNKYRLIGQAHKGFVVKFNEPHASGKQAAAAAMPREKIAIHTTVEVDGDNDELTKALECAYAVEERLGSISQLPFPRSLEADIEELYKLKRHVSDRSVRDKIDQVLQACESKEQELKDAADAASRQAQAEVLAMQEEQHRQQMQQQAEAEEKAAQEAQKQQKRNMWMLIGGAILAVLCFVGNGIFRHFRDVRNQKSMLEMQNTLTRQAENEASRRAAQVVNNTVHQGVNKAKTRVRTTINTKINSNKNKGMKSI